MSQSQIQEQKQEQKLAQSFSQQQLLQAQLTELPITQLIERINTEMDDNPALEVNADAPDDLESQDFLESQEDDEDFETTETVTFNENGDIELDEEDVIDESTMKRWCLQSLEVR